MATIELQGLTKRFRSVTAVDDLRLTLRPATVTGFLGVNGAGKTTTLRMLLGLVTPSAGAATFDGRRYADLDRPAHHVGAVLEASSFHPGRRAVDHLRILAAAGGMPAGRVTDALDRVGLGDVGRRRIGGFSLGMRQRLALAGALLGEPEVLILDEPANGLDPEGVQWLRTFLRAEAARGRTVVVSSHLLAEVAQTVDHVVIIDKGPRGGRCPAGRADLHRNRRGDRALAAGGRPARRPPLGAGVSARLTGPDEVSAPAATPDVWAGPSPSTASSSTPCTPTPRPWKTCSSSSHPPKGADPEIPHPSRAAAAAHHAGVPVPVTERGEATGLAITLVVSTVLHAGLGLAAGALVRNQAVAVGAVLVWVLKGEDLLATLPGLSGIGDWLPATLAEGLVGAGAGTPSPWVATAVLMAYLGALAFLGGPRLSLSRDVT